MTPETTEAFKRHAISEYPRECCGLVAIVNGRERYFPCSNVATTPEEHFVLPAHEYAQVEEYGEVVAVAHSHPSYPAEPSQADRVSCEASGLPWVIVSVRKQPEDDAPHTEEIVTIEPCGYEAPLVGRPFVHGVLDCFSLIRDWYKRESQVRLPDFEREAEWWDKGFDLYAANIEAHGFFPIPDAPKRGDMILMQIRAGVMNHGAIYLGEGIILHHLLGRLSSRDVYGGYWQSVTRMIVRHKDFQ